MDGFAVHFPSLDYTRNCLSDGGTTQESHQLYSCFISVTNPEPSILYLIVIFSLCLKNLSKASQRQHYLTVKLRGGSGKPIFFGTM